MFNNKRFQEIEKRLGTIEFIQRRDSNNILVKKYKKIIGKNVSIKELYDKSVYKPYFRNNFGVLLDVFVNEDGYLIASIRGEEQVRVMYGITIY